MRYVKVIVGSLIIILAVVFVLQNKGLQQPVHLGFSVSSILLAADAQKPGPGFDLPVFILVFAAFFTGIVFASVYSLAERYRLKGLVRKTVNRNKDLEEEIKRQRNAALNQTTTAHVEDEAEAAPPEESGAMEAELPEALTQPLPETNRVFGPERPKELTESEEDDEAGPSKAKEVPVGDSNKGDR